jgi:hypothetical protein
MARIDARDGARFGSHEKLHVLATGLGSKLGLSLGSLMWTQLKGPRYLEERATAESVGGSCHKRPLLNPEGQLR